jgi:hypothetical protein
VLILSKQASGRRTRQPLKRTGDRIMPTKRVTTLSQYVAAVRAIERRWKTRGRTTPAWFRGQTSSEWSLLPGLYREPGSSLRVRPELEREITRDFNLYAGPYLTVQGSHSALERLFIMQHHGLQTRLLDWTESHLVALFFAVVGFSSVGDAAVFALDPWRLNEFSIGQRTVPTVEHPSALQYALGDAHERIDRLVPAEHPMAVRPPHQTARIQAQNGFFTIHGHAQVPLEELPFKGLSKIIIASEKKKDMLQDLVGAGVSPRTLFPDLVGLCQDICLRYSDDFLGVSQGDRMSESDDSNDFYSSADAEDVVGPVQTPALSAPPQEALPTPATSGRALRTQRGPATSRPRASAVSAKRLQQPLSARGKRKKRD